MATRKVPSQAASGGETFNDKLIGLQITDGSSQLANTAFLIDRVIPEKDSKNFLTQPFSDFLTLDTLLEKQIFDQVVDMKISWYRHLMIGLKENTNSGTFSYITLKYGDEMIPSITKDYSPVPGVDYIPKRDASQYKKIIE